MKSSLFVFLLIMSTQSFSQAFPGSFKAERHFFSATSSCEQAAIPRETLEKLRNEAFLEDLTSQKSRCAELLGSKRESKHSCAFISVDGLNDLVADHLLIETLSGTCVSK